MRFVKNNIHTKSCGRNAKPNFRQNYSSTSLALIIISILCGLPGNTIPESAMARQRTANRPVGEGKGVYPGRVVWVHDPDATDWKGPGYGHWWQPEHTNQAVCDKMLSNAIQILTGESTDAAAWDAIFRYHNKTHGKGNTGYKSREKICIKVNFTSFVYTGGGVDERTYNLDAMQDYMNTSPQMIIALLRQLTQTVGVRQADISIGDSLAYFANEYYDILHKEFPNVRYLDCKGRFGRTKMTPSSVGLYWSSRPRGFKQDYVPRSYVEAEYLINIANLKAHPLSGVNLCATNHLSSLIRTPVENGYYDLDTGVSARESGRYRSLVDLMGHADIGGKTVLLLIDGLYGSLNSFEIIPNKFRTEPFNGDWTSSLFVSQDPVAIDSVGLDILQAEKSRYADMPGVDDYLNEAAMANNPPSRTIYDPDHSESVRRLPSLGVFEHWNNSKDKQYSRNLGRNEGIELITITGGVDNATSIFTPGAKVILLADGFGFTEGPAADMDGNVYFTDQPNNKIYKWSVDGQLSVFLDNAGRSNGLFFDKLGYLYACADQNNELWLIDNQGNHTTLVRNFNGKLLNGPNDLWIASNGAIYFTDPMYRRSYWTRGPIEQDGQHVYYLSPDRQQLVRVTEDLKQPNGIIGTPDGKHLYISDIGDRKTYRYNINPDGTLSGKKLFCAMGSDGMTIDNEGNIYLTGRGVTVFNSRGEQIEQIPINESWTANVCFGGKDGHTLFITASDSLYALQMRVHGVR